MNTTLKTAGLSALIVVVIALAGSWVIGDSSGVGSVSFGNEYRATSTDATSINGISVLKGNRGCSLGSVIIATTSNGILTIFNANAQVDTASTTLVLIPANTAVGTYTYDITCDRGLILEIDADFDGEYVITWR